MARLAQSVEHQTFTESTLKKSEGQGFESLIGRYFFSVKTWTNVLFFFIMSIQHMPDWK